MHLTHFLTTSLATIISTTTALPTTNCHSYILIQARGTSQPQSTPSTAFTHMVTWTLGNLTSGLNYNVVYPADFDPISYLTGSRDAVSQIRDGFASCPDQKYALLGYSQGAKVVLQTLKDIKGTAYEGAVKAVITMGDPMQVPGQSVTVDEEGGDATRGGVGSLLVANSGLGFSEEWVRSGIVKQFCYRGDPVCDVLSVVGGKGDLGNHTMYGSKMSVQELGAQWLIEHLK